ncbi:MAG: zinc ribbon domain-containing protein [Candidatus Bathyarchaeota archaeon]|nr:zinc ribbon domain-containing protein [Candidatus Bathyarchaeota archaeon]
MYKMSARLNVKHLRLIVILCLALTISLPLMVPRQVTVAAQTSGYYDKNFAWDYDGKHWTWNLSIPTALYDAYDAVPDNRRTRDGPAGYGFLTTTEDYYLNVLARKLNETTSQLGYSSFDQVSFILAFVQSLPYTSDSVTTGHDEYPRFPIETLVDDGGDCEDTSILFASLTLILGYGTVYINPPNHYAVGILGSNLRGTYWTYPSDSNKTYYYCETTGNNFKIGQLPDAFTGQNAMIYTIDESKQFVPAIAVVPDATSTPTPAPVTTGETPNPTRTQSPDVPNPTVKQPLEMSLNLILKNPLLFAFIIFAISASIALAVWSARRPRILSEVSSENSGGNSAEQKSKYCIHCGAPNKEYAVYCEKCGKQIGESPS